MPYFWWYAVEVVPSVQSVHECRGLSLLHRFVQAKLFVMGFKDWYSMKCWYPVTLLPHIVFHGCKSLVWLMSGAHPHMKVSIIGETHTWISKNLKPICCVAGVCCRIRCMSFIKACLFEINVKWSTCEIYHKYWFGLTDMFLCICNPGYPSIFTD